MYVFKIPVSKWKTHLSQFIEKFSKLVEMDCGKAYVKLSMEFGFSKIAFRLNFPIRKDIEN